jgi:hypothetical protein
MTSVQAGLSSARLFDELHSDVIVQETHLQDATSDSAFAEISARLGGRFAADLEVILRMPPARVGKQQSTLLLDRSEHDTLSKQQIAHVHLHPCSTASKDYGFLSQISIVPDQVKIDTEAGRIAYVLGEFAVFRAWAYGLAAGNGDGWIKRTALEKLWAQVDIASSPRHARRLIKEGVILGYWTQDTTRKRIYLTGQVKVAAQLVRKAMDTDNDIVGTNLPGRRRVAVNLAGSLQETSARLYAAWFASKDPQRKGTIVSRETLCKLWQVSVPTLLTWERIAGSTAKPIMRSKTIPPSIMYQTMPILP